MQKFWQQESGGSAGLFYLILATLLVCLLTGSAYGSGLVGSNLAGADRIPLPARKPLTLASVPESATPAPQPETAPGVIALLNPGTVKDGAIVAPRPARKPQRTPVTPVGTGDADLYKKIFDHQLRADWKAADELLPRLREDHLRGHVLFQRYMHPSYKSSFAELESWMAQYADLPGAEKIYRLAANRRPAGNKSSLREPAAAQSIGGGLIALDDISASYSASVKRNKAQRKSVDDLFATVRRDVSSGHPSKALKHLNNDASSSLLDDVEKDQLRAHIATGYLHEGKVRKAYEVAAAAAKRSGTNVPMAGWTGGLAAWRLGEYKQSAQLFEQVATSPFTSGWMSSAGAYWASRAHMRAGNTKAVSGWLRQAAAQPRTFYGLIATRALGWDFDFNWDMPRLTASYRKRLEDLPAARRAMALVAANQHHLAAEELGGINPGNDIELRQALLAYAHESGLPAVAMRLAETTPAPGGRMYDAALYPVVPWEPEGGFEVDRALILALIRQESRFDPEAKSGSGAMGLMQLMPATATFVAGDTNYKDREGRHSLKDPQTNLALGQRYVADLLQQRAVKEDLFSLAMAYNAGPGNLRKWKGQYADMQDDPLLFIESIPVGETRIFVERVMANYWIYRLRLRQKAPSLDAVAAGEYARYVSIDKDVAERKQFKLASR